MRSTGGWALSKVRQRALLLHRTGDAVLRSRARLAATHATALPHAQQHGVLVLGVCLSQAHYACIPYRTRYAKPLVWQRATGRVRHVLRLSQGQALPCHKPDLGICPRGLQKDEGLPQSSSYAHRCPRLRACPRWLRLTRSPHGGGFEPPWTRWQEARRALQQLHRLRWLPASQQSGG